MLKKRLVYILVILIAAFIVLFQPVRVAVRKKAADFFYPFFKLIIKVENTVSEKALMQRTKSDLIDEMTELKRENNELLAKCDHLESLILENNELRKLLNIDLNPYYNYVFAEIIYRDPVAWFNHFTIDKGIFSGIEPGAIVLARIPSEFKNDKSQFAVIGRVDSVSKHTALVNTIVSEECSLSVVIPENGATGVLAGGKRIGRDFWSTITYLPRDLIYKPYSQVFTSGMNNLTPGGLKVGTLLNGPDAINVHNNLFMEAKLKPSVNLNHLKFVLILVKK